MFQENHTPLFDPTTHTQGGVKHLTQHIWDLYVVDLKERIDKRKQAGDSTVELPVAIKKAPATDFVEFMGKYLLENRYVSQFFIDENVGIQLSDNTAVALCPGVANIQGTMQDARAVAVTKGEGRKDQNGVVNIHAALPIT